MKPGTHDTLCADDYSCQCAMIKWTRKDERAEITKRLTALAQDSTDLDLATLRAAIDAVEAS